MNFMQVYKKMSVLITESLFFINLILLVGGLMYFSDETHEFERIILFLYQPIWYSLNFVELSFGV